MVLGDQSISRNHVLITVEEEEEEGVFVTDQRSKYGTHVGQMKIEGGLKVPLQCGATFTLGQGTNTFR